MNMSAAVALYPKLIDLNLETENLKYGDDANNCLKATRPLN